MKIISELRSLKRQIIELQENQKEKELETIPSSSGMMCTTIGPVQRVEMLEIEIENLYNKLIYAQSKIIENYENNY